MGEENYLEEITNIMAEKCAISEEKGFIAGMKWIGSFIIQELEFQNLESVARNMERFINTKGVILRKKANLEMNIEKLEHKI